jgi:hypothetical protein
VSYISDFSLEELEEIYSVQKISQEIRRSCKAKFVYMIQDMCNNQYDLSDIDIKINIVKTLAPYMMIKGDTVATLKENKAQNELVQSVMGYDHLGTLKVMKAMKEAGEETIERQKSQSE